MSKDLVKLTPIKDCYWCIFREHLEQTQFLSLIKGTYCAYDKNNPRKVSDNRYSGTKIPKWCPLDDYKGDLV